MPSYEYHCVGCEKDYVIEAKMSDPAPAKGPACTLAECQLVKKISRFSGFVRGKATAPAPLPIRSAPKPEVNDTVHLCSKYCDHHAKV